MTITRTGAYEAIRTHHRLLSEQLTERVTAVSGAVAARQPHGAAVAGLIAYMAEEVLPHAAAEEATIYPAAAAHPELADTVGAMTTEHKTLSAAASRLAGLADGAAAAEQARQIAELFTSHAARENDILLPALVRDESVDLAALLDEMHKYAERAPSHGPAVEQPADQSTQAQSDPQATLVALLLQGAAALARAADADRACRLAASAWAAVHETRPDLAIKVTAALHGLTRRVAGEPVPSDEMQADGGARRTPRRADADPDLDVRDLPPAQRHQTIFAAYHALLPGAGFVLVNDHDPKPLRYQFEAEHAGDFSWDALEAGPRVWRVRIGRPPIAAYILAGQAQQRGEPDLDVRRVAHAQRHDVIFFTYRALPPGRGFVLVNDHDPVPLRYQFEARYTDEYTWDYLEQGPKVWRVRVGKTLARRLPARDACLCADPSVRHRPGGEEHTQPFGGCIREHLVSPGIEDLLLLEVMVQEPDGQLAAPRDADARIRLTLD